MTAPIKSLKKGDYVFRDAIYIGDNQQGRVYIAHIANTNRTYCFPVNESPDLDRFMKNEIRGDFEIHNMQEWDEIFKNSAITKKFRETSAQATYKFVEDNASDFIGIGAERYNYY